ncbi:MAG: sensor histidine kinase [Acidimicrobiia bacterium]
MTLRARLVAAFIAVIVLLGVSDIAVVLVERSYLREQVDSEIEGVTRVAGPIIARLSQNRNAVVSAEFSQYYIGRIGADGRLQTLVAPAADPNLVPWVEQPPDFGSPRTVTSQSGDASRVRIVERRLADGSIAVVGRSLEPVESAIRRLVVTEAIASLVVLALFALIVFWVVRLGLRPIRRMTETADAITAGATDVRVDVEHDGTEAARLGQAFNTMLDARQASEERLRQFVADASHELRTPLTTLRGYTSLYESGGFPDQASLDDGMRRIGQEAARMGRIVDDLLLLARLDEHGPALPTCVEVAPLLRDLASDVSVVQPVRPVIVDCAESVAVMIDRDHLVQALSALTTNAMRHTDDNVEVRLRAVHVDGRVRFEVTDRGPGIAETDVPHLFDRFYRSDRARSRATGGNGLGLAVVASIVTSNGGTYGVVTAEGLGSTFWFELPLAP